MQPIRVLQVFACMDRGGAETMIMNLYRNIDRTKVQFDFLVHTEKCGEYDNEIKAMGGRLFRVPQYSGFNTLLYKKALHKLFRSNQNEWMYIHGHYFTISLIFLGVAKKYGIYTIAHSHISLFGRKDLKSVLITLMARKVRSVADYSFACSQMAGKWMYGKGLNFNVIPNGIELERFLFDAKRRAVTRLALGIKDQFVVGHIGRFDTQKNHMFLLSFFRELHLRNPDTILLLVGDGDLHERIEKKIAELGLIGSVVLTGVRSDIPDLLQAMDAFVLPSLYEGLPVTAIEAQAAGLPCYISDAVTDEVCITPLVTRLPIDAGTAPWVKAIQLSRGERKDMSEQIKRAGYDVKQTAAWITRFYCGEEVD